MEGNHHGTRTSVMERAWNGKKETRVGQKERETRPPKNRRSSEELDAKLRRRRHTTAAMATPDESAETLVRPERRSSYFHSATCSMWLAGLASELIKKTRADETSNWEGRRGRMGEREEVRESSRGWPRLWLREGEVDKAGDMWSESTRPPPAASALVSRGR